MTTIATAAQTECTCQACRDLARRYSKDSDLLAYYRKKLLTRGWAGRLDPVERAYVFAHAAWAQAAVRNSGLTRAQKPTGGDDAEPAMILNGPVAA